MLICKKAQSVAGHWVFNMPLNQILIDRYIPKLFFFKYTLVDRKLMLF